MAKCHRYRVPFKQTGYIDLFISEGKSKTFLPEGEDSGFLSMEFRSFKKHYLSFEEAKNDYYSIRDFKERVQFLEGLLFFPVLYDDLTSANFYLQGATGFVDWIFCNLVEEAKQHNYFPLFEREYFDGDPVRFDLVFAQEFAKLLNDDLNLVYNYFEYLHSHIAQYVSPDNQIKEGGLSPLLRFSIPKDLYRQKKVRERFANVETAFYLTDALKRKWATVVGKSPIVHTNAAHKTAIEPGARAKSVECKLTIRNRSLIERLYKMLLSEDIKFIGEIDAETFILHFLPGAEIPEEKINWLKAKTTLRELLIQLEESLLMEVRGYTYEAYDQHITWNGKVLGQKFRGTNTDKPNHKSQIDAIIKRLKAFKEKK
jgi:hypothetical protein